MGRRGRRLPGTLTARDFEKVVRADGWFDVDGTRHLAFEHPTKSGKVNIDAGWTRVKPGSWIFTSVLHQASLTRDQFEDLYWASR